MEACIRLLLLCKKTSSTSNFLTAIYHFSQVPSWLALPVCVDLAGPACSRIDNFIHLSCGWQEEWSRVEIGAHIFFGSWLDVIWGISHVSLIQ